MIRLRMRKRLNNLFFFLGGIFLKYYYEEKPDITQYKEPKYGVTHTNYDHPIYSSCTLYKVNDKGLAVIQQRFDKGRKSTYWSFIDWYLVDPIYLNDKFLDYFNLKAKSADYQGFYPTVTVRQIMWALRMKPLKKERWETVFDRKDI